jgi:hypothetical protein
MVLETLDRLGEIHDQWDAYQAEEPVESLARLAERVTPRGLRPRLLELGAGEGRTALSLSGKGFDVARTELAGPVAPGPFDVVFVVADRLYRLPGQREQLHCLRRAAQRLRSGGALVVQGFVPDVARFDLDARCGERVELGALTVRTLGHDRVAQTLSLAYGQRDDENGERRVDYRYLWPAELDLMAELAGLALEDRWGGWRGEPFHAGCPTQVSVFRN